MFEYLVHNAQDITPPVGLNAVVDGTVPIGISPHSFFHDTISAIASSLCVNLILYREGIFLDFFFNKKESVEFSFWV